MSKVIYGWKDLRMSMLAGRLGTVNFPDLAAFGPSGVVEQLAFDVGDLVYVAGHVDHDIRLDSNMHPHVHWTTNGTQVNSVKWQVTYTAAIREGQAAFPTDTIVTLEEAATGIAWSHMVTEDATGFAALDIDSLWIAEIKRISNGATENTDTVFGLFVDLHYEVGQFATPNKAPNFYT